MIEETHDCMEQPKRAYIYRNWTTGEWHLMSDDIDLPLKYCPFCGKEFSK